MILLANCSVSQRLSISSNEASNLTSSFKLSRLIVPTGPQPPYMGLSLHLQVLPLLLAQSPLWIRRQTQDSSYRH